MTDQTTTREYSRDDELSALCDLFDAVDQAASLGYTLPSFVVAALFAVKEVRSGE